MMMATIGKVKDGQLEYELLIFDQGGMMKQLGASESNTALQQKVDALTAEVNTLKAEVKKWAKAEIQVQKNLALMQSADEAMNARDWDKFYETHTKDVYVSSPETPEPTINVKDHYDAVKAMVDAFPDHKIQLPYKSRFGSGDWLCAIIEQGGTFTKPWHKANGQIISANGKKILDHNGDCS